MYNIVSTFRTSEVLFIYYYIGIYYLYYFSSCSFLLCFPFRGFVLFYFYYYIFVFATDENPRLFTSRRRRRRRRYYISDFKRSLYIFFVLPIHSYYTVNIMTIIIINILCPENSNVKTAVKTLREIILLNLYTPV